MIQWSRLLLVAEEGGHQQHLPYRLIAQQIPCQRSEAMLVSSSHQLGPRQSQLRIHRVKPQLPVLEMVAVETVGTLSWAVSLEGKHPH